MNQAANNPKVGVFLSFLGDSAVAIEKVKTNRFLSKICALTFSFANLGERRRKR